MWIGGASRQAVASKTALVKPRYRALRSSCRRKAWPLIGALPWPSGAWRVEVTVVMASKPARWCSGPSADGHEVDIGTPAWCRWQQRQVDVGGFSPDVR